MSATRDKDQKVAYYPGCALEGTAHSYNRSTQAVGKALNNDKDGIIWPRSIAPFDVELIPLNMNDLNTVETAEELYAELKKNRIEARMDDREERAGVKLKDADLIGIPTQIILGEKNLKENLVEIKDRKTKKAVTVNVGEVVEQMKNLISG